MEHTQRFSNLFAALIVAALLGACGGKSDEPAAPAEAPATDTVEATADDATADEATAADEQDASDESLVVVEESAAEPEDTGEEAIVLAQADTAPAVM